MILSTIMLDTILAWIRWVKSNRKNILTFVGIVLVGIFSFESGYIRGKSAPSEPIIITLPPTNESVKADTIPEVSEPIAGVERTTATVSVDESCLYVGSKNSNKYHLATCAVAKRIKPENKICFTTTQDAEKRGYVPSCLK